MYTYISVLFDGFNKIGESIYFSNRILRIECSSFFWRASIGIIIFLVYNFREIADSDIKNKGETFTPYETRFEILNHGGVSKRSKGRDSVWRSAAAALGHALTDSQRVCECGIALQTAVTTLRNTRRNFIFVLSRADTFHHCNYNSFHRIAVKLHLPRILVHYLPFSLLSARIQ